MTTKKQNKTAKEYCLIFTEQEIRGLLNDLVQINVPIKMYLFVEQKVKEAEQRMLAQASEKQKK